MEAGMTPYIDYQYYIDEYGGGSIPAADFTKAARYASYKINEITFQRAPDYLDKYEKEIKLATCAVADALYETEGREAIASEHVGNYSVTYRTEGGVTSQAIRQAARQYLIGTGLMSRRIR
jgi:hypothetical protein